jgi:hypothetical protein
MRLSSWRSVCLMWRALWTSSGQPRGTHTVRSGTLRGNPRLSSGAVTHRMIPTPRGPHTVFFPRKGQRDREGRDIWEARLSRGYLFTFALDGDTAVQAREPRSRRHRQRVGTPKVL